MFILGKLDLTIADFLDLHTLLRQLPSPSSIEQPILVDHQCFFAIRYFYQHISLNQRLTCFRAQETAFALENIHIGIYSKEMRLKTSQYIKPFGALRYWTVQQS